VNVNKVAQVARREFVARVRSKAFIFTTLLVPGLFVLWGSISGLLQRTDIDQLRLSVLDFGTGIGGSLAERLEAVEALPIILEEILEVAPADQEAERQRLSNLIRDGELDGYLVLRPDDEIMARARYYARETGNPVIISRLERAVSATVLENWFTGEELTRVRRVQGADLETITVSEEGEEAGGFWVAYISTFVLGMLIYMMTLMHGQQMAMAIVEEKSSRLIELIIGAVTAVEFMAGKILGVLGAGLTQLAIWIAMGVVAVLIVLPGMAMTAGLLDMDLAEIFSLGTLSYFVVFFLLGYLMYVTLFAAIGATCNSTEELQHAMFPGMLPILIGFFSTFYVMTNPNAFASKLLSFIPLFTPFAMFARVNVAEPPLWEVWLGILLLLGAVVLSVYAAAKVFRVSILMHGKRPAMADIWRMVRTT
jgi:ABC-2 type transport system permease protein